MVLRPGLLCLVVVAGSMVGGCKSRDQLASTQVQPAGPVEARSIGGGDFCGAEHPEVRLVDAAAATGKLRRPPTLDLNGVASSATPDLPANDSYVWIALGQKPTLGYGLRLVERSGQLADGTLRLTAEFIEPAAGLMQAQVISMPCLVVAVSDAAIFDVEILDAAGQPRMRGR